MFLKNVKLAGFKSFVDPTTLHVRGAMTAIVGPNGCGKSNIVDAVRWVIGESSAKQLRGQSMSDVIFNGTTTRKPVGKAMVELLFDNSAGRIVGEYAKYAEIAIRREVERDGQSSYFLNGTHVRRRDILDLFLGTGLGPRSYSIIEQGVISRLVEAKPEEMRGHLEEVAGISKYKERRRETENRIKHTKENLDRLNDLREELDKQLRHLKRQAEAAERYKVYKAEERSLSGQIKALHWRELAKELAAQDKTISDLDLQREQTFTQERHLETELEKNRLLQQEANEQQNEVQKRFYALGAEIARLEQKINYSQEQIERWQKELGDVESTWQEINDNSLEHREQTRELEAELAQLNPQTSDIKERLVNAEQALAEAELAMNEWQQQWDHFQEESSKTSSQAQVAKHKVEHYQQQCEQLETRVNQLQAQLAECHVADLEAEIEPLVEELKEQQQRLAEIQHALDQYAEDISLGRDQVRQDNEALKHIQKELQNLEGRHTALQALQRAALGYDDEKTQAWVKAQSLDKQTRLGQMLDVKPGWEIAVETVLRGQFDALCVDELDTFLDAVPELAEGQLTLLERDSTIVALGEQKAPLLAEHISTNYPIVQWLAGIYVADDLASAKVLRQQLTAHESVITRQGIWLGQHWVRVAKQSGDDSGIIQREQALKELAAQIAETQNILAEQESALSAHELKLAELESARETAHADYQALTQATSELKSTLSSKQTHLQNMQQREQQLQHTLIDVQQELLQAQTELRDHQQQVDHLLTIEQNFSDRRETLLQQRDQSRQELEERRQIAQRSRQEDDELEIRLSANESQLALLNQTMNRDQKQLTQYAQRREELSENLANSGEPLALLQEELQVQLNQRLTVEQELQVAQDRLQQNEREQNELSKARQTASEKLAKHQAKLEKLRLNRQALAVRQTTIQEQLTEEELVLEEVIAGLPEEAELAQSEAQLQKILGRIQRLGAINLAAIDEFKATEERKVYLDKQNDDLVEALELLEAAISKIDKETKAKFRETFEKVNQGFQELFPKIFGGGRATLELEDNDLLTTGILVKAQPPGKRNSTIHMLSGGEKALTAISLVFSMFRLNPAPFCILDEVDAPLDDLNVGRFCQLVKEMSKEVQFLIISHNKVTIEIADQLMGVTMQEAGASRLVSVDMQVAMDMMDA